MRKKKKNKGFTLLEIISVIVIIGIIIVISGISVVKYVENSKAKTYESFKEDLRVATNNYMIDCATNNESSCTIPVKGNDIKLTYDELVDKGYSKQLKDPESDGYCDRSYVVAKNKSEYGMELEYKVCLYCDNYKSEEEGCTFDSIEDSVKPNCDYSKLVGASTEWTKENKEISIGCTDNGTGCVQNIYKQNLGIDNQVLEKGTIEIRDNAGNYNTCEVDVYVDKKLPTCEFETSQPSVNGWYKTGVTVSMKEYKDEGSGISTFGMGTSSTNRTYNGIISYIVNDSSDGVTTVFGYVKDKVGNENICSKDIKIDNTKPQTKIYMGYEVYPKENTTISDTIIMINNLTKYGNIKGIIIDFNSNINNSVAGSVYSNNTSIKTSGAVLSGRNQAIFKVTEGTYSNLKIDLEMEDIISNIKQVRVLKEENVTSVWTNKNISVYVEANDEITGIGGYSYDNGVTYIDKNIKEFSENTKGTLIVKDNVGNESISYSYQINKIDKTNPTLNIINPSNGSWTNQSISLTLNGKDEESGIDHYAYRNYNMKNSSYDTDTYISYSNSGVETFVTPQFTNETDQRTYIMVEDKAGNVTYANTRIRIDKTKPYTPALDVDKVWAASNVEDGTSYQTIYDLYCVLVDDNINVYPLDKGGLGSNALKKQKQDIICYQYLIWNSEGTKRLVYRIEEDLGGSGINWDGSKHRFGSGTYNQLENHHSWGTTAEKDIYDTGDGVKNHGSTASQLSGCTGYNISIAQYYVTDVAGNMADNLLTMFSISSRRENIIDETKSKNCALQSLYYFESNSSCKGIDCVTYDLP